jgi:hypothetical protein
MTAVAAVDLGASGGRVMLGVIGGRDRLELRAHGSPTPVRRRTQAICNRLGVGASIQARWSGPPTRACCDLAHGGGRGGPRRRRRPGHAGRHPRA